MATINLQEPLRPGIVGVLLAAGAGKRFGSNKLLNAKLNNKSIGLITAQTFQKVLHTYVVVRAGDLKSMALYESAGFDLVVAQHAENGMGNSLSEGIRRANSVGADACLMGLADMPLIEAETLATMCERINSGSEIVRPKYRGRAGQPVGVTRRHFEALSHLSADQGARDYLRKHEVLIDYLEVDDVGTVTDVDTPGDLAGVLAKVNDRES